MESPGTERSIRSAERQRISRELHNSTSQLLVALQLQLGQLKKMGAPGTETILKEMSELLRDIQASVREVGSRDSSDQEHSLDNDVRIANLFHSLAAAN
jgi:signal transduction histidine kinase